MTASTRAGETQAAPAQRVEHVNLVVTHVGPTADFLMTAFPGWRIRGEGGGEWCGVPRRWLHVGDDDYYLTLNEYLVPEAARGRHRNLKGVAPGLAHIGFAVSDLDGVIARLKAAGHDVDHPGETHPHRRNVYYIDDDGLEFEFVEYFSDKPEEKNSYHKRTSSHALRGIKWRAAVTSP